MCIRDRYIAIYRFARGVFSGGRKDVLTSLLDVGIGALIPLAVVAQDCGFQSPLPSPAPKTPVWQGGLPPERAPEQTRFVYSYTFGDASRVDDVLGRTRLLPAVNLGDSAQAGDLFTATSALKTLTFGDVAGVVDGTLP